MPGGAGGGQAEGDDQEVEGQAVGDAGVSGEEVGCADDDGVEEVDAVADGAEVAEPRVAQEDQGSVAGVEDGEAYGGEVAGGDGEDGPGG